MQKSLSAIAERLLLQTISVLLLDAADTARLISYLESGNT